MNLQLPKLAHLVALASFGFCVAASGRAAAQPEPPPPPAAVIATVEPVYYEGHAAYWYGGHWSWRDPHGWHTYHEEPAYLRDHRAHGAPPRHHYERRR